MKINQSEKEEGEKEAIEGTWKKSLMWRHKEGVASRKKGSCNMQREGEKRGSKKRPEQERNLASNKSIAVWPRLLPTSGNARTSWHPLRSWKQGFCSLGTGVARPNRPTGGDGGWRVKGSQLWGQLTLIQLNNSMPSSEAEKCSERGWREMSEGRYIKQTSWAEECEKNCWRWRVMAVNGAHSHLQNPPSESALALAHRVWLFLTISAIQVALCHFHLPPTQVKISAEQLMSGEKPQGFLFALVRSTRSDVDWQQWHLLKH